MIRILMSVELDYHCEADFSKDSVLMFRRMVQQRLLTLDQKVREVKITSFAFCSPPEQFLGETWNIPDD